jgi:hypothetical protein
MSKADEASKTPSELDRAIDRLWGDSGHGTRRIDIERAVAYGIKIGQKQQPREVPYIASESWNNACAGLGTKP